MTQKKLKRQDAFDEDEMTSEETSSETEEDADELSISDSEESEEDDDPEAIISDDTCDDAEDTLDDWDDLEDDEEDESDDESDEDDDDWDLMDDEDEDDEEDEDSDDEEEEEEREEEEEAENPEAKKKNWLKKQWSKRFPTKEEKAQARTDSFRDLNTMRQSYVGFDKDSIKKGSDLQAFLKLGETFITSELNVGAELATGALEAVIKSEPLLGLIGDAIKASYNILKRSVQMIRDMIKGGTEKNDDGSKKTGWQIFKDVLKAAKQRLLSMGDEVLGAVPFIRSIYSAIKTAYRVFEFFVINSTRNRMVENRRRFKEKYRGKSTDGENYVNKSKGFVSGFKRLIRVKKTNETVNKDLLKKRYRGTGGTRATLDKAEKKDIRQYLIDERLRKLNKRRQIGKAREFGSDALDTITNVMSDTSFVLTFTGPGAVGKAILDSVNLGIGLTKTVVDAAIDSADAVTLPQRQEKAAEYTGMILEHIGEMDAFDETDEQSVDEYDLVESDIDATGVDKKDLYKKNGKKDDQQKLLIEALVE